MNRLVIIGNGFDMAHIALACVGCIGRVGAAQLRDSPENYVRDACANSGMKREMGHQVILHLPSRRSVPLSSVQALLVRSPV